MLTDWPSIRGLLRRAILTGEVALSSAGYDVYRTHEPRGLDSDTRLTYCDVLYAIRRLSEGERRLIYADIGKPCNTDHNVPDYKKYRPKYATLTRLLLLEPVPEWHWHRERVDRDKLQEITDRIVEYVLVPA